MNKTTRTQAFCCLIDARDDLVRHQFAIFFIILAILQVAFLRVAIGAVEEEVSEEHGIKEGDDTVLEGVGHQAPRPGSDQLKQVLEVSGHAPETRGEQQGFLLGLLARLAVDDGVFCLDEPGEEGGDG